MEKLEITELKENWKETLEAIKNHIDFLEKEIPILIDNRPSDPKESELFDIKLRSMQSRLKRALNDMTNSTQPFKIIKH